MEPDPRKPEIQDDQKTQAPIAACDSLSEFEELIVDQLSDPTSEEDGEDE